MKHYDKIAEITLRSVLPEFPSSVTIVIPRQKSSLSLRSAHTTGGLNPESYIAILIKLVS